MARHLLIAVHLHADGMGTARYHGMYQGEPEWPPAPARLFQALVAGAAVGQRLPDAVLPALRWLEGLPPPLIAAPPRRLGQAVDAYVPNNDADALADPTDPSGIRTAKRIQPSLFDGAQPLLYVWNLPEREGRADVIMAAAQSLYQFGRGVDMAWARAHVLADDELHATLQHYRGLVHRPSGQAATRHRLPCPLPGSLDSLLQRHRAPRLRSEHTGKKARVLFTNPPKARFAVISYAPERRLALYELRDRQTHRLWPWPVQHAVALVEQVRDAAADRLRRAMPEATEAIERCLIGRAADDSGAVPIAQRIRLMPLPSIGAAHADFSIRRLLVEVPGGCPIAAADVDWAFSGLQRVDAETGELGAWLLVRAEQAAMQTHYSTATRHWLSVTPVALPVAAARRRIEPSRRRAEAKGSAERGAEEGRAVAAVQQALRHADVTAVAVQVHVQREPFSGHGQRAEDHGAATRFAKERLWHVAITFDRPVAGPLVIGDGRFVGLGVMAPEASVRGFRGDLATGSDGDGSGIVVLRAADAPVGPVDPLHLARALRRAVMSRVQEASPKKLDTYFSGHEADSNAPDAGSARHLAYHWDPPRGRWLLLAPHRLEHRPPCDEHKAHLALLDCALEGMSELRAGAAGCLAVQRVLPAGDDPLLARAAEWESVTPYVVTRHRRLASAAAALEADVRAECHRWGLPAPEVQVLSIESSPGDGLRGKLRLRFDVAVRGPLALGRSALLGGGLFAARERQR